MRLESDSMGSVEIPDDALYGAQTQRAVDNFKIGTNVMPAAFIRSLAHIKCAAARANRKCKALDAERARAIEHAALAVANGAHLEQFPVPVLQTGSGTSSNMNMNEVLARLASREAGIDIHPNDHVNCSQSSNDVIPGCIQVSALLALHSSLLPALTSLVSRLRARADELTNVVKTGRTHLMDAMPVTLGQELATWATQLAECEDRFRDSMPRLRQLPIGGSAVGTGVNVPAGFAAQVVAELEELTGQHFTLAASPSSRMAGQEVALECSSNLRLLATVHAKVANDLRWMASGPLSGLAEIELKPLQPGSSIMPGKVNPVLPEAVLMAAAEISGHDSTIALAAQSGNFQLNVMLPLIADKLLGAVDLAAGACAALEQTVRDFSVNTERVQQQLAANPILVTALNREIGYEKAAAIAKRCFEEQRPVLDVAAEETDLARDVLAQLLDPKRLTVNN
ncbi:MAG: class II fumarate hydratase [Halioglobus sp.]|nr:class II fumarate hydratase [Halioglobus sp.]